MDEKGNLMKDFQAGGSLLERASLRSRAKRGFNVALSAVLALSFSGIFSAAAYASEDDVINGWAEAIENFQNDKSNQAYDYADSDEATTAESTYKPSAKFDLRDPNGDGDRSDSVVTSVKLQNPWGTCWGFSTIAAAETSILSEKGETAAKSEMDLSELQLAKSVYNNDGAPEKYVGKDQAGEGYHNSSENPNAGLDAGGFFTYGSTVFASGIGPVPESYAPYKNAEGVMECYVIPSDGDNSKVEKKYLTEQEAQALEKDGNKVYRAFWAGKKENTDGSTTYYKWNVDEDLWNQSVYNLENGNALPSTRILNADGTWGGVNWSSVTAFKEQMEKYGRAVSIAYHADQATAEQKREGTYINENNWAHYTSTTASATHAVTIVGWDDTYAKENFKNASGKLPEGNGAWLVKNSWGAGDEEFPNGGSWGIVEKDADGNEYNTGYFWLSYYDQSITIPESFDFDTTSYSDNTQYYINQYDYLPEIQAIPNYSKTQISSANIFTAEGDQAVRNLAVSTYKPNTTVKYEVYLLDDDAKTPTDPEHSEKVFETTATYEYGGYHRTTLDESDWIAMREGQRFAVITTQKCNDDGLYYQGVAINIGKPSDEYVKAYEDQMWTSVENSVYQTMVSVLVQTYTQQHPEWSEGEVLAKAIDEAASKLESETVQAYIKNKVDTAVGTYKNAYFVSKVKAGESWSSVTWQVEGAAAQSDDDVPSVSADTEWVDWKTAVQEPIEANVVANGAKAVADNAAIKAFSEMSSWASVDELSALEQAIAAAKEALASAQISADGSDVPEGQTWMTQEQYDALSAAVAAAEEQLAKAGSDYENTLLNTTPDSDTVLKATSALSFDVQNGTQVVSADKTTKGKLAKTGDSAADAMLVAAFLAVAAGAAGVAYVARRRRAERR